MKILEDFSVVLKSWQLWLREHEKGLTLTFWVFIALVVIALLFLNLVRVRNNTSEVKADNALQTEILEKQNKRLQLQGERIQNQSDKLNRLIRLNNCLLDIHIQGRIPTDDECTFPSPPPPKTQTQNNSSQEKAPTNTPNKQGGGEPKEPEEPEEPSIIEQIIDFIT